MQRRIGFVCGMLMPNVENMSYVRWGQSSLRTPMYIRSVGPIGQYTQSVWENVNAFLHAWRYWAKIWHGVGYIFMPKYWKHIESMFSMWPHQNVRGQVALQLPYGYKIWKEEFLTTRLFIAAVKENAGVSLDQPEVKLLKMPYEYHIL